MASVVAHFSFQPPNGSRQPHRHAEPYAALVLSGGYIEAGPDGLWNCRPGDVVFNPPFHLHTNRFAQRGGKVLKLISSYQSDLQECHTFTVRRAKNPGNIERLSRVDPRSALLEAIENSTYRDADPVVDWRDALARQLPHSRTIGDALRVLDLNYSSAHVSRAFSDRFGIGPRTFGTEQKVRSALRAFSRREPGLAIIAAGTGFVDQAHMSKALKAATGYTPRALQKLLH